MSDTIEQQTLPMAPASRIIRAEVQNVLGIRLAEVRFDAEGGLTVVGGANGAGKSSLLDAIRWALDGERPRGKEMLRHDAEKGVVALELAGEVVEVRRSVTAAGTYLKASGASGAEIKRPQAVLDALVGQFGIDPTGFLLLSGEEQARRVQEVLGLDFADLDAQRKVIAEDRTVANRRVRDAEGELKGLPAPAAGAPTEVRSASALLEEIRCAEQVEAQANTYEAQINAERDRNAALKRDIAQLEERLVALREQQATVVARGKELVQALQLARRNADALLDEHRDSIRLRAQLEDIERLNAEVAKAQRRAEAEERRSRARVEAARCEERLASVDAERAARIAAAPVTVPGIDIREGAVYYQGRPLAEASDGERLRAAFEIASAGAPNLRVMFLRHGALLDARNRKAIAEMARQRGYTVILEVVGTSGIDVLVEDGVTR